MGSEVSPVALGVEDAQRHQRGLPGDAADAEAVVAARGDRAGDVRAVAIGVIGGGVVGDEVPALDEVRSQVGMVEVDARVDDGDAQAGRAGLLVHAAGAPILGSAH